MSDSLSRSAAVASILVVWFKTRGTPFFVFSYFMRLIASQNDANNKIEKEKAPKTPEFFSYPETLYLKHPNFFTRLLKCPICIAFWLSATISMGGCDNLAHFLTRWPLVNLGGLFLYFLLCKIMNED
jgi:hypothetical protein